MKLNTRDRWIVMCAAAVGAVVCLGFVGLFFMTIINNHLPWEHAQTAPAHYLAVGKSYSQGFTIGFFLAFSLALVAVSFAAWADDQRRARGADATPTAVSPDEPPAGLASAPRAPALALRLTAPTRDAV